VTGYYWGTAGWQDAAAQSPSRETAIREASNGTLKTRLNEVLSLALSVGTVGITFKDVCDELHIHHGKSSGALSNLHKQRKLFRLTEYQRDGCSVYIHPDHAHRFESSEYSRLPAETAMERLKRQAKEQEATIKQLMDEIAHLKRRLGES
jgi:hypothetical protein